MGIAELTFLAGLDIDKSCNPILKFQPIPLLNLPLPVYRIIIEQIHTHNKRDSCAYFISGLEIDRIWNPILKDLSFC